MQGDLQKSGLVISVLKDGSGNYHASRSFKGLGADAIMPGAIFTIEAGGKEDLRAVEDRVRTEARSRGIDYIRGID